MLTPHALRMHPDNIGFADADDSDEVAAQSGGPIK